MLFVLGLTQGHISYKTFEENNSKEVLPEFVLPQQQRRPLHEVIEIVLKLTLEGIKCPQ